MADKKQKNNAMQKRKQPETEFNASLCLSHDARREIERLNSELSLSHRRFQEVLDNAQDILYCYNPKQACYEFMSAAAETITPDESLSEEFLSTYFSHQIEGVSKIISWVKTL